MHLSVLLLFANLSSLCFVTITSQDSTETVLTEADFENIENEDVDEEPPDQSDPTDQGGHFEGDIDLSGRSVDDYIQDPLPSKFIQSNAIRNPLRRWPRGRIPYAVSRDFTVTERIRIAAAMLEFYKHTCVRFVPYSTEKDYVYIFKGKGCFATIGRDGGRQNLSIGPGCIFKGIILHEMMHAIGFFHEQSRNDRDEFVEILWKNIDPGEWGNFRSYSLRDIDHLNTQYDYGSIMHYGPSTFSRQSATVVCPDLSASHIIDVDSETYDQIVSYLYDSGDIRELQPL